MVKNKGVIRKLPYKARRKPQHKKLFVFVDKVIQDIQKLPCGWADLPEKGKRSPRAIRKKWARRLEESLFGDEFKRIALTLCLVPHIGVPTLEGKEIYRWLVQYVYNGVESRLYRDYLRLLKKDN